jgi:uncharacterized protein YjiS (DUF1127 family)
MRSHHWNDVRRIPADRTIALEPLQAFLRRLAEGLRRGRQRRDLASLSDHHLRDIGLSRTDVTRELMKPLWRE